MGIEGGKGPLLRSSPRREEKLVPQVPLEDRVPSILSGRRPLAEHDGQDTKAARPSGGLCHTAADRGKSREGPTGNVSQKRKNSMLGHKGMHGMTPKGRDRRSSVHSNIGSRPPCAREGLTFAIENRDLIEVSKAR